MSTLPMTVPCRVGGNMAVAFKRSRGAFHTWLWLGLLVFLLSWIAIPLLPKYTYCALCNTKRQLERIEPAVNGQE